MTHPFLTAEQVQERNRKIYARAVSNPKPTNVALGLEFGLNRETIRLILKRRIERDERVAAKFKGVFAKEAANWVSVDKQKKTAAELEEIVKVRMGAGDFRVTVHANPSCLG